MKNNRQFERWSPWLLLVAVLVFWQIICSAFGVSEFIFPSPWRIWTQFWEFKEIIAGHVNEFSEWLAAGPRHPGAPLPTQPHGAKT